GPSASSRPGISQNCFRRALEMTRICGSSPAPEGIVVRKMRTVEAKHRPRPGRRWRGARHALAFPPRSAAPAGMYVTRRPAQDRQSLAAPGTMPPPSPNGSHGGAALGKGAKPLAIGLMALALVAAGAAYR